jgi:hypothetical protein
VPTPARLGADERGQERFANLFPPEEVFLFLFLPLPNLSTWMIEQLAEEVFSTVIPRADAPYRPKSLS